MITGKQIRAARALLGWDAEALGSLVGMHRVSIQNIERGKAEPPMETVDKIIHAFEKEKVEFIGEVGIKFRDDQVTTYGAENAYIRMLDDVFHTISGTENPEALFFFVDNSKSSAAVIKSHERIREAGIACKYLCHESPKVLTFPAEDYRAIPDEFYQNDASIVYGDKYGIMILDDKGRDAGAVVIRNERLAKTQRNLFKYIWTFSKKVEKTEEGKKK
jgi:DNA-binding XRE family transcriptional regulator